MQAVKEVITLVARDVSMGYVAAFKSHVTPCRVR